MHSDHCRPRRHQFPSAALTAAAAQGRATTRANSRAREARVASARSSGEPRTPRERATHWTRSAATHSHKPKPSATASWQLSKAQSSSKDGSQHGATCSRQSGVLISRACCSGNARTRSQMRHQLRRPRRRALRACGLESCIICQGSRCRRAQLSSGRSRSTSTRYRARRAATWPTTSWPPMMLTVAALGRIAHAPKLFKACALRNPVTNLGAMVGSSDIPDWVACECASSGTPPGPEVLKKLFAMSPISGSIASRRPSCWLWV